MCVKPTLHSWDKSHLVVVETTLIFKSYWIQFASILLRTFASIYIAYCLQFPLTVMSLSGLGIVVIMVSYIKLESIPFFLLVKLCPTPLSQLQYIC